jgi:hypothetical protein
MGLGWGMREGPVTFDKSRIRHHESRITIVGVAEYNLCAPGCSHPCNGSTTRLRPN